ncbi:MAG: hypothetical protein GYB68_11525 [Chloroflexi bacterium]|nr:hypothetical protein [Chloroflexota bacterium]
MNENLRAVRDSVMQGLGQLTDFFGFSPVMGHLYGALFMSPLPLSLDELEETVEKSKASVSMNMRALERWGMVHEVWVKGDRRKYYEAETDLWKIVTSVLQSRERREVGVALQVLEDNARQLKDAQPDLSDEERELADYYLARVKDMQMFFLFAQRSLEFLLGRRKLPRIEDVASTYRSDPSE